MFGSVAFAMLIQLAPIDLTGRTAVVALDVKQVSQLAAAAESKTRIVVLRLDDVAAERAPGIYWEVYAGPPGVRPNPNGPFFVGNVALFGSGIRSEAPVGFKAAHFVFPLNGALRAARHAHAAHLVLTFVPRASEGAGSPATPRSRVRAGRVAVAVEDEKPR
ncbi:MAG TPA: hypothetical protein VIW69_18455 [Candidatus Elarobacter sp.]